MKDSDDVIVHQVNTVVRQELGNETDIALFAWNLK